jgi:hypothetical protein
MLPHTRCLTNLLAFTDCSAVLDQGKVVLEMYLCWKFVCGKEGGSISPDGILRSILFFLSFRFPYLSSLTQARYYPHSTNSSALGNTTRSTYILLASHPVPEPNASTHTGVSPTCSRSQDIEPSWNMARSFSQYIIWTQTICEKDGVRIPPTACAKAVASVFFWLADNRSPPVCLANSLSRISQADLTADSTR